MKKNLLLIIPVLAILLLLLIFRNHQPFGKSNTSFSASQGNDITRIELSDKSSKVTLGKEGDKWLINGKIEARKSAVMMISRVLRELKIKSPVSPEMFDTLIHQKNIIPVRVKVFGGHKLLTSFLVYKTSSNIYGNIMKKNERSKPFIVFVPGFDGNISSMFNLHVMFWQPYTIFNLLPSEITTVGLENNADPANSFSISRREESYKLLQNGSEVQGCDSTLVRRYLSYFTWVPFESWALDLPTGEKEKIITGTPAFVISVLEVSGRKTILTLWNRSTPDGKVDTDRLYGKIDTSNEIFIVRYFDIDPLLKKKSYFFPSSDF